MTTQDIHWQLKNKHNTVFRALDAQHVRITIADKSLRHAVGNNKTTTTRQTISSV